MSELKIAHVERIIGHEFVNKHLCAEAIQMAALQYPVTIGGASHSISNNHRLAVLGFSVLVVALCKAWYKARSSTGIEYSMIFGQNS